MNDNIIILPIEIYIAGVKNRAGFVTAHKAIMFGLGHRLLNPYFKLLQNNLR